MQMLSSAEVGQLVWSRRGRALLLTTWLGGGSTVAGILIGIGLLQPHLGAHGSIVNAGSLWKTRYLSRASI